MTLLFVKSRQVKIRQTQALIFPSIRQRGLPGNRDPLEFHQCAKRNQRHQMTYSFIYFATVTAQMSCID